MLVRDIEYRLAPIEVPSESDPQDLRLAGYAAMFNAPSHPLMVRGHRVVETIARGAFTRSLVEDPQSLYWQHDPSMPLASTASDTLDLIEDEKGLRYEAWLPQTTLARDAVALVRAGIVTQMSFGFLVRDDHLDLAAGTRELRDVQLVEVSLVEHAAYPQTSAAARSLTHSPDALSRPALRLRYLLTRR